MDTTFDLDTRFGLPEDLRALLVRYPRETWEGHANLGQTARFWLARHDMFRELGAALHDALHRHREGEVELAAFRGWFSPRLGFFLRELEGHHQIEDHHYFPVFVRAETGLARGFDLLENDHEVIHDDLLRTAEAARAFLSAEEDALTAAKDTARYSADAYGDASERLLRRLIRHLADEEDLIIPVILDRTEAALGL